MLVVIVDVERATSVFVSGSARVVFSQGCTLFLSKKTVDLFVEDSIFVIQFVVIVFELSRKSFSCFQLCITWKSFFHVINVVTIFLRLRSSLSLESWVWQIFLHRWSEVGTPCKQLEWWERVTRSMSHSFGLAKLWLFSNLTVFSLAWWFHQGTSNSRDSTLFGVSVRTFCQSVSFLSGPLNLQASTFEQATDKVWRPEVVSSFWNLRFRIWEAESLSKCWGELGMSNLTISSRISENWGLQFLLNKKKTNGEYTDSLDSRYIPTVKSITKN